ncbi:hypothetical protein AAHA92_30686 [Salvia divinorum]|uniref:Uncharacterized protein n=1 Tax=Salvia divinorum TaxID=28513 RepID=A0ABD1FSM0_SALDI
MKKGNSGEESIALLIPAKLLVLHILIQYLSLSEIYTERCSLSTVLVVDSSDTEMLFSVAGASGLRGLCRRPRKQPPLWLSSHSSDPFP